MPFGSYAGVHRPARPSLVTGIGLVLVLLPTPNAAAAGRCNEPRSVTLVNAPLVRVFQLTGERSSETYLNPTACNRQTGRRVALGMVSRPGAIAVRGTRIAYGEVFQEDTFAHSGRPLMFVTRLRLAGSGVLPWGQLPGSLPVEAPRQIGPGGFRFDPGVVRTALGGGGAVAWSTCENDPPGGYFRCRRNGVGAIVVAPRRAFEPISSGDSEVRPEPRILALSTRVDPFSLRLTSGTRIMWNERGRGRKVAALPR